MGIITEIHPLQCLNRFKTLSTHLTRRFRLSLSFPRHHVPIT